MQNRRKFIKNSLLTLTAAGFAGKYYNSPAQESGLKEGRFIYRTLGKTGIKIPIVSMGTGNTSNPSLVRSALDKGISLLGTSEAYQNGNNERLIGAVIKNLPRNSYLILTNSFFPVSLLNKIISFFSNSLLPNSILNGTPFISQSLNLNPGFSFLLSISTLKFFNFSFWKFPAFPVFFPF